MSEKELKNFSVEDLGTEKDSQYRTAEGTLLQAVEQNSSGARSYQPGRANLSYALP